MNQGRVAIAIFAVVVTVSLLGQAQTGTYQPAWNVTVPFSYHAGNHVMAPGVYRVSWNSGAIRIVNESNGESVTILPFSKDEPRLVGTSFLRFTDYGGEKFLHDVYFSGREVSNSMPVSKLEIAVAKKFAKSDVFLAQEKTKEQNKTGAAQDVQGQ